MTKSELDAIRERLAGNDELPHGPLCAASEHAPTRCETERERAFNRAYCEADAIAYRILDDARALLAEVEHLNERLDCYGREMVEARAKARKAEAEVERLREPAMVKVLAPDGVPIAIVRAEPGWTTEYTMPHYIPKSDDCK